MGGGSSAVLATSEEPGVRIRKGEVLFWLLYSGLYYCMTFQRSLYISIAIHILLLGSAIAYAQYTRGVSGMYPGPIMVSLVGSGQTLSQREGTKNAREKPSSQIDPVHQEADAAVQRDKDGFLE